MLVLVLTDASKLECMIRECKIENNKQKSNNKEEKIKIMSSMNFALVLEEECHARYEENQ